MTSQDQEQHPVNGVAHGGKWRAKSSTDRQHEDLFWKSLDTLRVHRREKNKDVEIVGIGLPHFTFVFLPDGEAEVD